MIRNASPCEGGMPEAGSEPGIGTAGANATQANATRRVEPIDLLRAREYALLSALLIRAPDRDLLPRLARIDGDSSPLGRAHSGLARAASLADADAVECEYFALFVGVGRGELLPYGSYYLKGLLNERPLAQVRADLDALGIERVRDQPEPEDHIALLCEIMAGLAAGNFPAEPEAQPQFFRRHLQPWAARFFADLERAPAARLYRAVGALGR